MHPLPHGPGRQRPLPISKSHAWSIEEGSRSGDVGSQSDVGTAGAMVVDGDYDERVLPYTTGETQRVP